jgi:hypothetical protein
MKANNLMNKTERKNRRLGIAFIFLFAVSVLFPIIASVMNKSDHVLKIPGFFDVAIAISCFMLFAALYMINAKQIDDKIITRTKKIVEYIATIPLILIVLYFSGVKINWEILLIGLGWRFWLLIMAIPYIIAASRRTG